MRGYDQDVLRKHARHILSKLSTKDAKLFGGKEELGNVVNVFRRLAEEQDRYEQELRELKKTD